MHERRPWPRDPRFLVGPDGSIIGPRGPKTPFPNSDGYLVISVYRPGGKSRLIAVHIMVCETFHGPRPPGHQAAHHDGDPLNPSAENVRWKTPAENAADKIRHGRTIDGERNGAAVLTLAQVREIRASGEHPAILARRYGVSRPTIYDIRSGYTWARVR